MARGAVYFAMKLDNPTNLDDGLSESHEYDDKIAPFILKAHIMNFPAQTDKNRQQMGQKET